MKYLFLLLIILLTACGTQEEKISPTASATPHRPALAGLPTLPSVAPTQDRNVPIEVDDPRFPIEPDAAGKALYETNCAPCHGINGEGQAADSTGLITAPPHNNQGHTWHHPDQQNLATAYLGRHVPGAYPMPSFKDTLTVDEIFSILAYIKTWWGEQELAMQRDSTLRFSQR